MKSQKDCVFASIMKFFTNAKINYTDGEVAKEKIDTEGRKVIHGYIFEGLKSGEVTLKKEMTDEQITKYIPGLLSNHLRKDKRLNGGESYVPAEPGKFTGNSDPQIKEMRKLLKKVKGTEAEAAIQAGLDKLVEAWRAVNKKETTVIDAELIPEEFRKLVG